ncbi:MAG TPA: SseB family protein [Acidimicrobiia bacterium]|nr:SseB family protein [Acidimicrobiia bacterium]
MVSDDQRAMPPPSLAEVASDAAAGRATPQELHDAFLKAQVVCEAGDRPGFVAVGPPGDGFIPVFTSEVELARARGPVRWFATTGADLFGLVPEGYDLILDIAGLAPLRLSPSAVQRSTVAEVDWRR